MLGDYASTIDNSLGVCRTFNSFFLGGILIEEGTKQ